MVERTSTVKSAWSVCIQSLKPTSYPINGEIIKDVKETFITFLCYGYLFYDLRFFLRCTL